MDLNSTPRSKPYTLFLVIAGVVLFLPFLGRTHLFDWDEINFAECAREMIVVKNYLLVTINFQPFWEKPPLFIWMQVLSMKLFGVSDYAARLPNALCGIATMVLLFKTGTRWKNKRFGLLWVLAYIGSLLPQFYFKSGIIDPWFNFFIFTGLCFFIRFQKKSDKTHIEDRGAFSLPPFFFLFISAFFTGLAILTKGPVSFLILFLTVIIYWLSNKMRPVVKTSGIIFYLVVVVAVGGSWFAIETLTGHSKINMQFIQYQIRLFNTQDSGHGGPFYYHFIVLLIGCFPASLFAIRGMMLKPEDDTMKVAARWMKILFWVVLLLFTIVKTKILHYSSLCYYPLTFFAALALYEIGENAANWKKWMGWTIAVLGGLLGLSLTLLPIAGKSKQLIIPFIKDPFTVANLNAAVNWTFNDSIPGIMLLAALLTGFLFIKNGKPFRGGIAFFAGTLIATNLALTAITPKIEQITQQAAIDFYQGLIGKDVYVSTIDYKSYAQFYYADVQPPPHIRLTNNPYYLKGEDWTNLLLTGNIDKPAFFVCKITAARKVESSYPALKELYRQSGFVFLEREPSP